MALEHMLSTDPKIEKFARNLRGSNTEVPVDVVRLAERLGPIQIFNVSESMNYVSGFHLQYADHKEIYVNGKLDRTWKRYAVAKELAAILLNKAEDTTTADDLVNMINTAAVGGLFGSEEAKLASAILIDAEGVSRAWDQFRDPDELARIYQVPTAVMERRLADLGLVSR